MVKGIFVFTRKVAWFLWNILRMIYTVSRVIKYISLPYLWRLWIRVFSKIRWFHMHFWTDADEVELLIFNTVNTKT